MDQIIWNLILAAMGVGTVYLAIVLGERRGLEQARRRVGWCRSCWNYAHADCVGVKGCLCACYGVQPKA